jgi:hypothetical protein
MLFASTVAGRRASRSKNEIAREALGLRHDRGCRGELKQGLRRTARVRALAGAVGALLVASTSQRALERRSGSRRFALYARRRATNALPGHER